MFRQYAEHKKKHKDAVLFFRMGDFYEMFRSDAVEVSRMLNLTLTQRQGIPMCGIPYHAAGNYIGRLLKLGKKVAICEQIELPEGGKGLAKREVVEVVTPGTVVDDAYLDERSNNYLAAFAGDPESPAFAYIDLSTGEFRATQLKGSKVLDSLKRELTRIAPKEIIIQESLLERNEFSFLQNQNYVLDRVPDWSFNYDASRDRLHKQFHTINLKAFGFKDNDRRIPVAGVILEYLEDQHRGILPHIQGITLYDETQAVGMDESTIRNLELVSNLRDGGSQFTLLDTLDHTKTAPGIRALRRRLLEPFPDVESASSQHDRVEFLYRDQSRLSNLRESLAKVLDLERLSARAAMERAHAKDLLAICKTLGLLEQIRDIAGDSLLDDGNGDLEAMFASLAVLRDLLEKALMDNPSILLSEGRMIREGWNTELDEMRHVRDEGRKLLDEYILEEKAATGIGSLKLKYNRILGHFIEVAKSQAKNMPDRFRRRQSLSQVERFTSARLEDLETEILSVRERITDKERDLFIGIRDQVKTVVPELLRAAGIIASIDLAQSFAHTATEYGYVRPKLLTEPKLLIQGGRHPVVERHIPQGEFVPNSIELDVEGVSFALVTGPNMAGKSTVLRQVALITLMAQAGSFIPADSGDIGMADKIFCRVGASDNLARGESTFLVEMNETANILRNASRHSLVIMDEVGRGTGTEDGLAIARAVCEFLLTQQTPRTLFATHYRELTRISHIKLKNLSMAVNEVGDQIVFPKNLIDGPAAASYGIHVASLAGLPNDVIMRAKEFLIQHRENSGDTKDVMQVESYAESQKKSLEQSSFLFDPRDLILDSLSAIDTDNLTPLEALKLLVQWQSELESNS